MDACDISGIERPVVPTKRQARSCRGVHAATARILFVACASRGAVERLAPVFEYAFGIEVARAVEHVEEALLVLERVWIRRKSFAREQRRHQSAVRALAGAQGF